MRAPDSWPAAASARAGSSDRRPGPASRGRRSATRCSAPGRTATTRSRTAGCCAVNSRTWPKRCVSQPVSGTEIALATANEVMTQVPCDGLTPMSPAIAGIDTLAIDVSSTFMNVASDSASVPSTSCAALQRRVGRAAAAGAPRLACGGGDDARPPRRSLAVLMTNGVRRGSQRRGDAGRRRRGRARRASGARGRIAAGAAARLGAARQRAPAVRRDDAAHLGVGAAVEPVEYASSAARTPRCAPSASMRPSVSLDVDLGLHRQADPQRMGGELLRIERDAHRHALHHLDPVAGGVLRRQQRERGAGAGAEALDRAVVVDLLAVDVGLELDRLADAQLAQLAFLEVGVDPDLVERDHRHQRRAGLHALAELHAALARRSRRPARAARRAAGAR